MIIFSHFFNSLVILFSAWKQKPPTKMPSELEIAMESLITVFHRYAKDGRLNRAELRKLMENELSNFLRVRGGQREGRTQHVPP